MAFTIAVELGFNEEEVLQAISTLKRVNGRFETIKSDGGIFFIVDYAHTPDALENVLGFHQRNQNQKRKINHRFRLWRRQRPCKRPEMGKIATRKSTLAIITTDNPRTENPQDIIKEIEAGVEPQNFSKYTSIPDRESDKNGNKIR